LTIGHQKLKSRPTQRRKVKEYNYFLRPYQPAIIINLVQSQGLIHYSNGLLSTERRFHTSLSSCGMTSPCGVLFWNHNVESHTFLLRLITAAHPSRTVIPTLQCTRLNIIDTQFAAVESPQTETDEITGFPRAK
jgi:hypothetical protein